MHLRSLRPSDEAGPAATVEMLERLALRYLTGNRLEALLVRIDRDRASLRPTMSFASS